MRRQATDGLDPLRHHRHVAQLQRRDELAQQRRLLPDRVDQRPAHVGTRQGERDGRHPAPRAEVDHPSRFRRVEERQRRQRIERVRQIFRHGGRMREHRDPLPA